MTLAQRTLEIAKAEIGKSEQPKGSNWGPDVKKYLASVGINFSAPWCMAFVYYCVDTASKELKAVNPLFKTGGVMVQWQKSNKKIGKRANPQPGDVFIMDFGKGLGHTGLVLSVDGDHIHTIEGNSNNTGSREGVEVCPHTRKLSSIMGYLKLS